MRSTPRARGRPGAKPWNKLRISAAARPTPRMTVPGCAMPSPVSTNGSRSPLFNTAVITKVIRGSHCWGWWCGWEWWELRQPCGKSCPDDCRWRLCTLEIMQNWLANPWALSLLGIMPLLSILAMIGRRLRCRRRARLGSPLAVAALVEGRRGWPALQALILLLAMLIWIVGIAGPQWGLDPEATATSGRDLVVLIDVSRSMLADDVRDVNRLEQAKR